MTTNSCLDQSFDRGFESLLSVCPDEKFCATIESRLIESAGFNTSLENECTLWARNYSACLEIVEHFTPQGLLSKLMDLHRVISSKIKLLKSFENMTKIEVFGTI